MSDSLPTCVDPEAAARYYHAKALRGAVELFIAEEKLEEGAVMDKCRDLLSVLKLVLDDNALKTCQCVHRRRGSDTPRRRCDPKETLQSWAMSRGGSAYYYSSKSSTGSKPGFYGSCVVWWTGFNAMSTISHHGDTAAEAEDRAAAQMCRDLGIADAK